MAWEKLGLVYCPPKEGRHIKLLTHAANPVPVHMYDNIYRIFYSGRDDRNRSSVGAVDIDILTSKTVCDHHEPFFTHGGPESFYVDGVSIGNCYAVGTKTYLTFMGWQNPKNAHWRGDIGRLIVNPDFTLSLAEEKPLIAADETDPTSLSYPWVSGSEGSYSMWYGSTINWDTGNGEMLHVLRHAMSHDGHSWKKTGHTVPYDIGTAQAFSRPTLASDELGQHMWFSYRTGKLNDHYKIGYAKSEDGIAWSLQLDRCSLLPSGTTWESEMTEYPFVFQHHGQRYMLYNGNAFGKTGFGLAQWKS